MSVYYMGSIPPGIPAEELLRAEAYDLLADLLCAPADHETLDMVAELDGDSSEVGRAVRVLAQAARRVSPVQVAEEYNALFGGPGCPVPEVVPTASAYHSGFLDERPLARLRADLARLDLEDEVDIGHPEDHIAVLCRVMAGLISGTFGIDPDLDLQQQFFQTHIAGWAPTFFTRLEASRAAAFYMPVGTIGRRFMLVERQAFALAA